MLQRGGYKNAKKKFPCGLIEEYSTVFVNIKKCFVINTDSMLSSIYR